MVCYLGKLYDWIVWIKSQLQKKYFVGEKLQSIVCVRMKSFQRLEMWLHELDKPLRITKSIWDRWLPTISSKGIIASKLIVKLKRSCNLRGSIQI